MDRRDQVLDEAPRQFVCNVPSVGSGSDLESP